jgi:hypothetical protein
MRERKRVFKSGKVATIGRTFHPRWLFATFSLINNDQAQGQIHLVHSGDPMDAQSISKSFVR